MDIGEGTQCKAAESISVGICKASSNNKYLDKNAGWGKERKINRFSIHERNGLMENLHVHIKKAEKEKKKKRKQPMEKVEKIGQHLQGSFFRKK